MRNDFCSDELAQCVYDKMWAIAALAENDGLKVVYKGWNLCSVLDFNKSYQFPMPHHALLSHEELDGWKHNAKVWDSEENEVFIYYFE